MSEEHVQIIASLAFELENCSVYPAVHVERLLVGDAIFRFVNGSVLGQDCPQNPDTKNGTRKTGHRRLLKIAEPEREHRVFILEQSTMSLFPRLFFLAFFLAFFFLVVPFSSYNHLTPAVGPALRRLGR